MVTEKTFAVIAIVVVALSFAAGSSFLSGAATAGQFDFYIDSVKFPEKILVNEPFTAVGTFTSTRTLPSTFVTYDYRIFDDSGHEYFRVRDGLAYAQLPTGTSTSNLEKVELSKRGKYEVRIAIDFKNQFIETDENNNIYETTITVV